MKKTTFFFVLIASAICINKLTAQVLYTETFDTFTLGDLGTDVTGQIPGQGGWYTIGATNAQYAIITEPNKGKVLSLFTNNPQQVQYFNVEKRNLTTLIDQKTIGNNVIKVEIDFYTGSISNADNSVGSGIALSYDLPQNDPNPNLTLMNFYFDYTVGFFNVLGNNGLGGTTRVIRTGYPILSFDAWYQLIFYLDYTNKKCYFEIPGINITGNGDFLTQAVNPANFKLSSIQLNMGISGIKGTSKREQRFDNIKITALKAVPTYLLSDNSFLAEKFSLYPNPANGVVNITNAENMLVNQVAIYDVAGKQLSTQTYKNETEIQLNIEHLASGTYLLHLQTNEGTAVKKLVKN